MSVDTLRVLRPDDMGCTQWFGGYSIGDVWILKGKFVEITPTPGFGQDQKSLGVYFTLIPCDVTYLKVKANRVEGAITRKCGPRKFESSLRQPARDDEENPERLKCWQPEIQSWSYRQFIRQAKRATQNINYSGSEQIKKRIDG